MRYDVIWRLQRAGLVSLATTFRHRPKIHYSASRPLPVFSHLVHVEVHDIQKVPSFLADVNCRVVETS